MDSTRRRLLKLGVAAASGAAVGLHLPEHLLALGETLQASWRWDKGVCRFYPAV